MAICVLVVVAGCTEEVAPSVPCAAAAGGGIVEWEFDGVPGRGCSDSPLDMASLELSPLGDIETHTLTFGVAVEGSYPPSPVCGVGGVTMMEAPIETGRSGSVAPVLGETVPDVPNVSVSASACDGGTRLRAASGTWRSWRDGDRGTVLVRDVDFEGLEGHTFRIRRLIWTGTVNTMPIVHGGAGIDAGARPDE
jgi:hypothetical protein